LWVRLLRLCFSPEEMWLTSDTSQIELESAAH
jgi:hypothetical protein